MTGRLSVLDALASAGNSENPHVLAKYLPLVDAAVPRLLEHGLLSDSDMIQIVEELAATHQPTWRASLDALNALELDEPLMGERRAGARVGPGGERPL